MSTATAKGWNHPGAAEMTMTQVYNATGQDVVFQYAGIRYRIASKPDDPRAITVPLGHAKHWCGDPNTTAADWAKEVERLQSLHPYEVFQAIKAGQIGCTHFPGLMSQGGIKEIDNTPEVFGDEPVYDQNANYSGGVSMSKDDIEALMFEAQANREMAYDTKVEELGYENIGVDRSLSTTKVKRGDINSLGFGVPGVSADF